MTKPRVFWVLIFLAGWLLSAAGGGAWAKNKAEGPQVAQPEEKVEKKSGKKKAAKKTKKGKKTDPEPAATAVKPQPAGIEEPRTLLSQAQKLESEGDVPGCVQTLAKFVNVFPRHPERAATLQRMGQLAQDRGQGDKALQIYALTAFLYPGSQAGAEARWQVQTMEFYQYLRKGDPVAVFKDYLQKVKFPSPGVAAAKMKEPLRQGWQAVEQVLRRSSPCPVHLVEEALALWELHPEGSQPPEAALILGELLQEQGLYGEARSYLQRAREQGTPSVCARALVGLLEAAWASVDLQDFAAVWTLWRRHQGEITPELKSRLAKMPLPKEFFSEGPAPGQGEKTEEDSLAALLDWWSGKAPDAARQADLLQCLTHFLSQPLPQGVKEKLFLQLAQLQSAQGHYPQAAQIYQQLLAAGAKGGTSAFYQDRLALSQLQDRQPEVALQIYRGLSQEGDNFWQLVSRTRLADVELGRLQMEHTQ